jgi:hypothetical protein
LRQAAAGELGVRPQRLKEDAMSNVWTIRGFLIGSIILFALSFVLPTLGDWNRLGDSMLGYMALMGALLALSHPSSVENNGLVIAALSVVANLFFLCGWVYLAFPSLRRGSAGHRFLMAFGLFSFVLALSPMLVLGPTRLLFGYYIWVLTIGMLTVWLWCSGQEGLKA